jgi:hypothetical protein
MPGNPDPRFATPVQSNIKFKAVEKFSQAEAELIVKNVAACKQGGAESPAYKKFTGASVE